MGQADDGNVLDLVIGAQEVFDLDGVDVFTAGDDHVLLAVDQIDEAFLVLTGHIAGEEPVVLQDLVGGIGILIVAGHDTVALDNQLANVAGVHIYTVFVHDAGLPAVAGLADGTDLVYIFNTQMDTAGTDGLGQAVVGVILMVGEHLHPTADQAGGHGLSADVHQSPLIQAEFAQVCTAVIDGVQQVLGPGDQQPDDGALFFGHGPEDPLRLDAPEQHGLGAGQEAAEPVHLGAGVVEGRNAQEHIVTALGMVVLLGQAGMDQSLVLVQDGLGEAGGAGGEVDGSIVLFVQSHRRCAGGAEAGEGQAVLGVSGTVIANVEHGLDVGDLVGNGIHTADKFRTEYQHFHVR